MSNKSFYCTSSPDRYEILKEFAKQNRAHLTLAEDYIWSELKDQALGVRFRRQCIIGDYIVDFVCLSKQLIIEVDGAYHFELEQQERDIARTASLERMGFTVIRYTNEEVLNNLPSVVNQIQTIIHNI